MAPPDGDRTRIVVVDDHLLFREGIREILEMQPDLDVIGEAEDSAGAVSLIGLARPDVVLLDVEIPGDPVAVTVRRIAEAAPDSRVIILSMYDGPRLITDLLREPNVRGYLLKSVSRHELVAFVRAATTGGDRVVLSVSRGSVQQMVAEPSPAPDDSPLSERERDVLRLTAAALSNAQIAARLGLSEPTVKRHLRNIFVKLNAVSRVDAVNKGVAAGLLPPPQTRPTGAEQPGR